jgi:hypothetical protein
MNATVLSDRLHQALYDVIHPIGDNGKRVTRCQKSTLPVLAHVLITDHEGRIAIYTHDLEKPLVTYAAARVDESFSICVPAHPFLDWMDIIKKDGARVDLTVLPLTCELVVRADNARATFKCMDAEEFPSIRDAREPGEKDHTLASVGLAVSKDQCRPELQRVCHRDGLMMASDGYRLHIAPSEKTEIPEGFPDVTVILETLSVPDYTVIVPAAPLVKAVKSLKAVSKRGEGLVTFHCNGSVEITADSSEEDRSSVQVEVLNSTGGEVKFTLPIAHVLDALTHVCPRVKAPKGRRAEPQTVTIHATPRNALEILGPIWFTNGDLKAAVMPKLDEIGQAAMERRERIHKLMTPEPQRVLTLEEIEEIIDEITQPCEPVEIPANVTSVTYAI